MRGSHLKEDLEALEVLGPGPALRIRARMAPESLRAIEEATRIEYLPLDAHMEMVEAVHAESGEAGTRLWAKTSLLASLGGVFRPLFEAATALFSPSPTLLCKYFPKGWLMTYRGCGEFVVEEPRPGRTVLTGRGLPEAMTREPFRRALCGTFESAFAFSRYEGTVECLPGDASPAEVRWAIEWRRLQG